MPEGYRPRFNFSDPANVYLSFERNPWRLVLVVALVLLSLLAFSVIAVCDKCTPVVVHNRGTLFLALIMLIPFVVRVALVAVTFGYMGELLFRRTYCEYDSAPDYAIGPSGIADLNPWTPRAFSWKEIREIQRDWTSGSIFQKPRPLALVFIANNVPRWGIPAWLWDLVPTWLTGRRIELCPLAVGVPEAEILQQVERFAGPIKVTDYYLPR